LSAVCDLLLEGLQVSKSRDQVLSLLRKISQPESEFDFQAAFESLGSWISTYTSQKQACVEESGCKASRERVFKRVRHFWSKIHGGYKIGRYCTLEYENMELFKIDYE
jgi:hypothetical protein